MTEPNSRFADLSCLTCLAVGRLAWHSTLDGKRIYLKCCDCGAEFARLTMPENRQYDWNDGERWQRDKYREQAEIVQGARRALTPKRWLCDCGEHHFNGCRTQGGVNA